MRLLFISNVFPNPREPTKGTFNWELVRALAGFHSIQVINPVSWLDAWRSKQNGQLTPLDPLENVEVHHPRYYYTPKVLREWYGRFMWSSIRRQVKHVLADHKPEAVLSYWAHPDGEMAVRAARLGGVPALVMVGGSDVLLLTRSGGRRRRILGVLHSADAIVTVSQDLRSKLTNFGIDPEKISVVYRGVNSERFAPGDRNAARQRLGIPVDERVLLWVGRMVPVKGLDVLLSACAALQQRGVKHRLYLVGDGPVRKSLENQAKALGIECSFPGVVAPAHLASWYRAANVTVLPSLSEGVPNVLRESQACGTSFVASRVGGIPEIAIPERDTLVPPGDADKLADALARSLSMERGYEVPNRTPIGWPESARQITELLEKLIKSPRQTALGALVTKRPSPLRQLARRTLALTLPRRLLLLRGPRTSNAVCLTFDDGPHREHTPRLLDVLKQHRIRATFFVVGRQAEQHLDLLHRITAEGHALGHHSYTHSDPRQITAGQLLEEVQDTQRLFRQSLGRSSQLFRPPWGKLTAGKLWKLSRAGFRHVLWNLDPKDYACRSSAEVDNWFSRRTLQAGDVILMHDTHPYAAGAIPRLATAAADRGLRFTTVDEWVQ